MQLRLNNDAQITSSCFTGARDIETNKRVVFGCVVRLKCPRFIHSKDSKTTATRPPRTIEIASKTDAHVLCIIRMSNH